MGPSGHYVATNIMSFERHRLPDALSWEVVYDDGDASIPPVLVGARDEAGEQDPVILELADLFRGFVMRSGSGEMKIVDQSSSAERLLADEACRLRRGRADMYVSDTGSKISITCCAVVLPRPDNSRLYWNLLQVHKFLNIAAFDGSFAQWFFRGQGSWTRAFAKLFGDTGGSEQVLHRMAHTYDDSQKAKLPLRMRCTPWPSISTKGLLTSAIRWHALPRAKGGLGNARNRTCCAVLSRGILDALSTLPGPLEVHLHMCHIWSCSWPRPSPPPDGENIVMLKITSGEVDFTELKRLATSPRKRASLAKKWLSLLAVELLGSSVRDLYEVLLAAAAEPGLQCFFARLVSAVAMGIERAAGAFVTQPARAKSSAQPPFAFSWQTAKCMIEEDGMCAYLLQYVTNCREALRIVCEDGSFSLATDKGNVNGLPLQDTVLALPNNMAWLCAPTVAGVSRASVL